MTRSITAAVLLQWLQKNAPNGLAGESRVTHGLLLHVMPSKITPTTELPHATWPVTGIWRVTLATFLGTRLRNENCHKCANVRKRLYIYIYIYIYMCVCVCVASACFMTPLLSICNLARPHPSVPT